jgi:membrane protein required for colicin V production
MAGETTMLLDILIVLLIIGGVAFGLWKGLLNQGVAILGVYLGALLGRFIYDPIARPIAATTGFDLHLAQLLAFLLIIIAVPILLLVVARTLWGSLRLPHAWGQADLVGGTALGAVVGLLAAMFVVLTFGFLVTTAHLNSAATTYPLFDQIQAAWSASLLRGPVVEVGHVLYYILLPNVGKSSPDILQVFAPR